MNRGFLLPVIKTGARDVISQFSKKTTAVLSKPNPLFRASAIK